MPPGLERTFAGFASWVVVAILGPSDLDSGAAMAISPPVSPQPVGTESEPQVPGDMEPPPSIDDDAEPPYDFYERQWRYRMRNVRPDRFSRDSRWGEWYRYPGGWRLQRRDDRDVTPFYLQRPDVWGYYGGFPEEAFEEGYWEGRQDGRRLAEWEAHAERGRASYLDAMKLGIESFQKGDYTAAVKSFILAAKLNQGDPASRLHAAHALVAAGHYADAALTVRRAIQLQPNLVYLALDIRRDYGRSDDFDAHFGKLKAAAEQAGDAPDLWFLLGYYQFFSGREADAYQSLLKAEELNPGERTTRRLLDAARLAAPADKPRHPKSTEDAAEPRPTST